MENHALQKIVEAVVREMGVSSSITLDVARNLSEQIRKKASDIGVKAVVAVSDKAGHPILVECMDNAFIASYDIAVNKAFTVVSLKMSTSALNR